MHPVELEARLLWERSPLQSPYFSSSPSRLLCASAIFTLLLDPCTFVSLPLFHQCFLGFFPHSLCLSIEVLKSHRSPIFIFQPFLTQRRCTLRPLCPALPDPLMGRGQSDVCWYWPCHFLFPASDCSLSPSDCYSLLLQPKLATILPKHTHKATHSWTKENKQSCPTPAKLKMHLKMAFLSYSVSQLHQVP